MTTEIVTLKGGDLPDGGEGQHDDAERESRTRARKGAAGPSSTPDPPVLHQYDDIQEFDNNLPNWWLYTLYATIIFAMGYWFYYQVYQAGESPSQAYHREMQADYARAAAAARAAGTVTPAALLAMSRDDATVRAGQQIFTSTCAACHRADGAGNIGPNLTDAFWLHGSAPDQIYRTVTDGVTNKGMPAWGPQLGADRVQSVVAYVLTLKNTNVAGGKAPQGDRAD